MSEEHNGSCLCGAVRFRARGALREVVYCHCSQCRKQTGHHYAATNVAKACLEIDGEDYIRWYRASDSAGRGFCSTCGSALFWQADGRDYVSILAGAFDSPSSLKAGFHIYCADKGDYYEITDGLPAYPVNGPS